MDQAFKWKTVFLKNKINRNDKISDGNGKLILDNGNKVGRWKKYNEKLYQGDDELVNI
jgi:hypothetical protein